MSADGVERPLNTSKARPAPPGGSGQKLPDDKLAEAAMIAAQAFCSLVNTLERVACKLEKAIDEEQARKSFTQQ